MSFHLTGSPRRGCPLELSVPRTKKKGEKKVKNSSGVGVQSALGGKTAL
jgi:hypothetical protein